MRWYVLVIRDRSTANNGTINERRYAMQDGNWNKQASTPTEKGGCSASALETAPPCFICDTTGSVGERYAYSAYGAPVFMTGGYRVPSITMAKARQMLVFGPECEER